jgi:DNA-directed RNA polymerase specialized sigma24 family protein
MPEEPLTENGEEADFRELLKKAKADLRSVEALLETRVFKKRLRIICGSLTFNDQEARELSCDVSVRVWTKFSIFQPDYTKDYGNFFAWLRKIAQNKHVDNLRHPELSLSDDRPEDLLDISDKNERIDRAVERKVVIDRFWKFVGECDALTQTVMQDWREGFSFRETEAKLAKNGIKYSHVAVGNLQERVIAEFIESEKAHRKPNVTRKGEQTSKLRKRRMPPARKTGSKPE